jgi:hypothetical protein
MVRTCGKNTRRKNFEEVAKNTPERKNVCWGGKKKVRERETALKMI